MKLGEITIRDPFIFPDAAGRCYYLYGTTLKERGYAETGFYGFKSRDLKEWDGPFPVFIPDGSFWADSDFWAPEVHFYHGKYYMFATFRKDGFCRGTQILFSETPDGMFVPLTEKPVTPPDWECLDGTLFVDDNGIPYMIFCHEWLQVSDGEMCVMPLSADLREAAGEVQCRSFVRSNIGIINRTETAVKMMQAVNQPSFGRRTGTRSVAITPPTMAQSFPPAMMAVRSSTSEVITVVSA